MVLQYRGLHSLDETRQVSPESDKLIECLCVGPWAVITVGKLGIENQVLLIGSLAPSLYTGIRWRGISADASVTNRSLEGGVSLGSGWTCEYIHGEEDEDI